MEVQTFLLAAKIERDEHGYVGHNLCCVDCFPVDGKFPLNETFDSLLLLRRANEEKAEPFTLQFNVIDEEGRSIGKVELTDSFDAGQKFLYARGTIECAFPKPGDYRIDITPDGTGAVAMYSYDLRVSRPQSAASSV